SDKGCADGYVYGPDDQGTTWTLIKKNQRSVLRIAPEAINSPEVQEFVRIFHLRPGRIQYDITQEELNPCPSVANKRRGSLLYLPMQLLSTPGSVCHEHLRAPLRKNHALHTCLTSRAYSPHDTRTSRAVQRRSR